MSDHSPTLDLPTTDPAVLRDSETFHRHVLDHVPTPLIVVDSDARIVYANDSMLRLGGWNRDDTVGAHIFDHIHPDDVPWLGEAFVLLATKKLNGLPTVIDRPWAPINFRILTNDGQSVPVEVTGRDVLDDPAVSGVIYEVRAARERDIFQRVLAGVASGGDVVRQLDLVMELVSATMLEIAAAVVVCRPDGSCEIVTSTGDDLQEVLELAAAEGELAPFVAPASAPVFVDVADLGTTLSASLHELGYLDAWHVGIAVPAVERDYRIVAFTPVHHIPAMGVIDRLNRAAELAGVILVRVRSDEMLDRAAHHDPLTDLPNRLGLSRRINAIGGDHADLAVLFVDLDGFKTVNDRHGHSIGDLVLREVAERLSAVTRSTDLVARLGGDEFAIVLGRSPGQPHTPESATAFAERVLSVLATPISVAGIEARVSASIGFVSVAPGTDLETAVERADRAMYVAKRAGGGRVHDADAPEYSH